MRFKEWLQNEVGMGFETPKTPNPIATQKDTQKIVQRTLASDLGTEFTQKAMGASPKKVLNTAMDVAQKGIKQNLPNPTQVATDASTVAKSLAHTVTGEKPKI